MSAAAFIAAAFIATGSAHQKQVIFCLTTQTKRGSGDKKRFHQVEIGGDVLLTHCVDWPLD